MIDSQEIKSALKLFHVSQKVNTGYDTYSDFVVCCETEDDARHTNPGGFYKWHDDAWWFQYENSHETNDGPNGDGTWCNPAKVRVEYVGIAAPGIDKGIICSSFHAG